MEELQVQITALEAGSIDFNFEEMKQYLAESLEEFRTAVFTDASIKDAKHYVAELRKGQKAFKDRITEVKKTYMAPFDEFKAKADELVRLYDEPIEFINAQVQDFEARRKAEKRAKIEELYAEAFEQIRELVALDRVYDPRWENATYKINDIQRELIEKATKIITEINVIRNNPSSFAEKAEQIYLRDFDLGEALRHIQEYEAVKEAELERQRQAEIKRQIEEAKRAEREKILAEQKAEEEKQAAVEQAKDEALDAYIPEQVEGDEAEAHLYSINLTQAEKKALEMYMDSVGLEWEEI